MTADICAYVGARAIMAAATVFLERSVRFVWRARMRATLFIIFVAAAKAAPAEKWRSASLSFEPNTGQTAADVKYLARTGNFVLCMTDRGTVFAGLNQPPLRT